MSRPFPGARSFLAAGAVVAHLWRLGTFAAAHPWLVFRRSVSFPRRVAAVRRILREMMDPAALDELLWAFRGYHTEWSDPHFRARRWDKVRLSAIAPADTDGMPVDEMAGIMSIAMEIEDPIPLYSRNSGEGFRFILPTLARYTGMNAEQAAYAEANGLTWCESSWCEEEKRHAPALAHAIAHLTGRPSPPCKPNEVAPVTSSEQGTLHHLARREATEWGSSATYVVLAAHARGELRGLMLNLSRDEVKHLAILSAADVYVVGPRPWRRLVGISKIMAEFVRHHAGHRSSGDTMTGNVVTGVEILVAMALEEFYLRRWLEGLGLPVLRLIFETESTLPVLAAFEPTLPERDEIERRLAEDAARRARLARWPARAAAGALAAERAEHEYCAVLDEIVRSRLSAFSGADEAGSRADRMMRRRVSQLLLRDVPSTERRSVRVALRGRLRVDQLRNNRYVRSKRGERLGSERLTLA